MLDSCVRCTSVSFTLEHCTDIVSLYPFFFKKKKKQAFDSRVPIFCVTFQAEHREGSPWQPSSVPHSGGNSDDCARGGDTSSSGSLRCWLRCPTIRTPRWTPRMPPYGDRRFGTSTGVGPAEYFELSSDDGRPTAGTRAACMLEPCPQGTVERHSGIGYELVQPLDAPVLQMVEQLPDVFQFFATCLPVVADQVIDVPKISVEDIPARTSGSRAAAGGTVGGSADHPLPPQATDFCADRRQSSSAWSWASSSRFSPKTESDSALLSRSLTFLVVAHSPAGVGDADDAFQGFFFSRTFPRHKEKCERHSAGHCRSRRGHQRMDAGGL